MRKKKILSCFTIIIILLMSLIGCSKLIKADTEIEFLKELLTCNNIKTFYSNVVDGQTTLKDMNEKSKESSKEKLEELKEKYDNNQLTYKILSKDKKSGYSKIGIYNKGNNPSSEKSMDIYYVLSTDSGYKLDANITGYNEVDILQFQEKNQENPEDFKVYAKFGDTYKYELQKVKDDYYCIEMSTSYSSSVYYGYVEKDSEEGKKLNKLLGNGKEAQVTLSLSIPNWIEPKHDLFIINKVVSEMWLNK